MKPVTLTAEAAQQIEEALNAATLNKDHWLEKCMDSLDTIRAARAQEQAEQEPLAVVEDWPTDKTPKGIVALGDIKELPAGTLLYASPATSTEVFTREKVDSLLIAAYTKGRNDLLEKQVEHEPIGYIDAADLRELCNGNERQYSLFTEDKGRMVAIYAAPVRTKDLTDAELNNLWIGSTKGGWIGLFRTVIAADRERNK